MKKSNITRRLLCILSFVLCIPLVSYAADITSTMNDKIQQGPLLDLQLQINQLKEDLANIELTPGPQGPQGPIGPSDAYATYLQWGSCSVLEDCPHIGDSHVPGGTWTRSLTLPQGSYVIMGTVHVANLGSEPGEAWCGVSASGKSITPLSDVETAQIPGYTIMPNNALNIHPTSIAFNLAVTLTNTTNTAYISCFNNAMQPSTSDLYVLNFHLSAIKVGTLTYQP